MSSYCSKVFICQSEKETAQFAERLALIIKDEWYPYRLYLDGQLGAGKTTFSRYFIQALGIKGTVKSPTYTLIEPYQFSLNEEGAQGELLHMDLYRLGSPLELHDLGFLEEESALWLIEWPEKGIGVLPEADLMLRFVRNGEALNLTVRSNSAKGEMLVKHLSELDRTDLL